MKTNYIFASLFRVTQIKTLFFTKNIKNQICPLLGIVGHFFCTRPKHNQYSLLGGCLRGFRPLSFKTLKFTLKCIQDATLSVYSHSHYATHSGNKASVCSLTGGRGQTHNLTNLLSIFSKNKVYVIN